MIKIALRDESTYFMAGLKGRVQLPVIDSKTTIQCFITSPVVSKLLCALAHLETGGYDVCAQRGLPIFETKSNNFGWPELHFAKAFIFKRIKHDFFHLLLRFSILELLEYAFSSDFNVRGALEHQVTGKDLYKIAHLQKLLKLKKVINREMTS